MKGTEHPNNPVSEDTLEALFRHASAREKPPHEDELAIRQALHEQWKELTRKSKRRRTFMTWAAVASVALTVVVVTNLEKRPASDLPVIEIAQVEKLQGQVLIQPGGDSTGKNLEPEVALEPGNRILSAENSGLAIRWIDGESIRVDEHTELRLTSASEIELVSGKIYLDTNDAESGSKLVITTPSGTVRHLGTRYMTEVSAGGTSVSVREGRVQVLHSKWAAEASGGEQLNVNVAGDYDLEPVVTYGPRWQWSEELAPAFVYNGRSIADFLAWVAHETGRVVEFSSPEAEQLATETQLRGQVDLEPMRALTLVMQTSDLTSEVNAGSIVVALLVEN